jgi:hypothetical protein
MEDTQRKSRATLWREPIDRVREEARLLAGKRPILRRLSNGRHPQIVEIANAICPCCTMIAPFVRGEVARGGKEERAWRLYRLTTLVSTKKGFLDNLVRCFGGTDKSPHIPTQRGMALREEPGEKQIA